jgi:transitional endoplasmic reticulum ATPase
MNAHAKTPAREAVVSPVILTPTQRRAWDEMERSLAANGMVYLGSESAGTGKSTLLKAFSDHHGGHFVRLDDYIAAYQKGYDTENPTLPILRMILEAIELHPLVVMDVLRPPEGAINGTFPFWLSCIAGRVRETGHRFIFTGNDAVIGDMGGRSFMKPILLGEFEAEDFQCLVEAKLSDLVSLDVDFDLIYRSTGVLTGYDISLLCNILINEDNGYNLERFAHVIDSYIVSSNIRIEQIEELSFDGLPGAEHIAAKLETHIILPLENPKLAQELDLKPKRGVLLYGPPGSGKTSIGRALAHRMKGKFFLIDGTIKTEPPPQFFNALKSIIHTAEQHSPCVLFIDDADVLFDIPHITGFARYLLTFLDGMESQSAGKVCLMMTAMDVRKVPAAILRSGRVELWLETRLPDLETRARILRRWTDHGLPGHEAVDYQAVATKAERFNPADLRRVVADAKALFAVDEKYGRPLGSADHYLEQAIVDLIATRKRMADKLHDDDLRIGAAQELPKRGKYAQGIGGLVEAKSGACTVKEW